MEIKVAVVPAGGVTGLGPEGRAVQVPAGEYEVVNLDGVSPDVLYLRKPGTKKELLACVQRGDVLVRDAD